MLASFAAKADKQTLMRMNLLVARRRESGSELEGRAEDEN